jgi:lysine 6-dehydrogenase
MPSFVYTRKELDHFVAKTIRWPGHWQGIETLKQCGLLDLTPVEFGGKLTETINASISIPPRDFVAKVLEPKLRQQDGDTDSCVMWNTVFGTINGCETRIDQYMWDDADPQNQISSMARVTGFTAASAAVMLGSGKITEVGIVAPEDGVHGENYDRLIAELKDRRIEIMETESHYLEQKPQTAPVPVQVYG